MIEQTLHKLLAQASFFQSEFLLGGLALFLVFISMLLDTNKFKTVILLFTSFVMVSAALTLVEQRGAINTSILFDVFHIHSSVIYFKYIIIISGILSVLMYFFEEDEFDVEPLIFIVSIVCGLNFFISSTHMLSMYVSLEVVSLTSYILVYRKTAKSSEAALKYFLFGAVASAILLYGISLIYGITGEFSYDGISSKIINVGIPQESRYMFYAGLMMIVFGLLFKIGVFPMHFWIPDVYEASSTPVTAFFSMAPKVGGVVALLFLYIYLKLLSFEMMAAIAVVTVTAGNLPALWQTNIKRLLAYSSIAHSGFLMLAFVALGGASAHSMDVLNLYLLVYLTMNYAAFFMVQVIEANGLEATLDNIKGLGKPIIILGVFATALAVSLTGLPPTGGFMAKLFVLTSFWDLSAEMNKSIFWIVFIIAIVNTAIALFYYIKMPYFMYFKEQQNSQFYVSPTKKILLALMTVILVGSFIKFNWLIDFVGMLN